MHRLEQTPSPISIPKVTDVTPLHPMSIDVPVKIRYSTREEKRSLLRFDIGMVISSSASKLTIKVTDEVDPFFYYIMEYGETEFHAMKSEQQILVDF
jgi:hypothetical protein